MLIAGTFDNLPLMWVRFFEILVIISFLRFLEIIECIFFIWFFSMDPIFCLIKFYVFQVESRCSVFSKVWGVFYLKSSTIGWKSKFSTTISDLSFISNLNPFTGTLSLSCIEQLFWIRQLTQFESVWRSYLCFEMPDNRCFGDYKIYRCC